MTDRPTATLKPSTINNRYCTVMAGIRGRPSFLHTVSEHGSPPSGSYYRRSVIKKDRLRPQESQHIPSCVLLLYAEHPE